jgi:hypothetical protein
VRHFTSAKTASSVASSRSRRWRWPFELADAGDEGGVVAFDLGELDVEAAVLGRGARSGGQGGQIGETVTDGIEHGRLQPDGMLQRVEGLEHAAHRRLAPRGERPLQVLALELLGRDVVGRVVLAGLEQVPAGEGGQRPLERVVVNRLVPTVVAHMWCPVTVTPL